MNEGSYNKMHVIDYFIIHMISIHHVTALFNRFTNQLLQRLFFSLFFSFIHRFHQDPSILRSLRVGRQSSRLTSETYSSSLFPRPVIQRLISHSTRRALLQICSHLSFPIPPIESARLLEICGRKRINWYSFNGTQKRWVFIILSN